MAEDSAVVSFGAVSGERAPNPRHLFIDVVAAQVTREGQAGLRRPQEATDERGRVDEQAQLAVDPKL